MLRKTAEERFWARVDRSGGDDVCWTWLAVRNYFGYGRFWHKAKDQPAHRVAYQIAVGEIPGGMCVLHRCDNPSCVNPQHLFIGTRADNALDMWAKNRGRGGSRPGSRVGELNPNAKLNWDLVRELRHVHRESGSGCRKLARLFGVSRTNIHHIITGRAWVETETNLDA